MKRIVFVVPTFNRKLLLIDLLNSISRLQIPQNAEVLSVVVVDGSNDGTIEAIEKSNLPIHVVVGDGNWWWTKSVNKGIEKAISLQASHILLMNDDNILPEDYLLVLLNDFKSLTKHSVLGSASVSISASNTIDAAGYCKFNKLMFKLHPYKKTGTEIDDSFVGVHQSCALSGRGTLIPVEVIQKVGLFDESLVQYGSDDDFTMRCIQAQIPVYISWNARVFNYSEITSKERNKQFVSIIDIVKAFFNPYSASSLKKEFILYTKHSYKIFAPVYCVYLFFAGILLHSLHKFKTST